MIKWLIKAINKMKPHSPISITIPSLRSETRDENKRQDEFLNENIQVVSSSNKSPKNIPNNQKK